MRPLFIGLLTACVLLSGGVAIIASRQGGSSPVVTLDAARGPDPAAQETAGLCPWRNPDADRARFFPAATGNEDETLLLSRQRAVVTRLLGHAPTGTDNALPVHWLVRDKQRVGAILTKALRGESGVIELVLAVGMDGAVVGAKLQRLREPDEVAQLLQSPAWLGTFRGKTARDAWRAGQDIPMVPATARISADAILDGAHTLLVLLDVGRNGTSGTSAQRKTTH
jgi:hypothetical protein